MNKRDLSIEVFMKNLINTVSRQKYEYTSIAVKINYTRISLEQSHFNDAFIVQYFRLQETDW